MEEWSSQGEVTQIGFGDYHMRQAPKAKGRLQECKWSPDLKDADLSDRVVGMDLRVYEVRRGLINCYAPVKPVGHPKVYVDQINWDSLPPDEELAWLYREFFCKYDREVLMLVGRRHDGTGWLYYVPEQEGTSGLVTWTADDEDMNDFQALASWVGTIHVHPGVSCTPSQTDVDDWANPEKSGLHIIFGRDGSFTVNGAIANRTFQLDEGSIAKTPATMVDFVTSKGRPLGVLLKTPKPLIVRGTAFGDYHGSKQGRIYHNCKPPALDHCIQGGYLDKMLYRIGAVRVTHGLSKLRLVRHNNGSYVMTGEQYGQLRLLCKDVCPIPKWRRLGVKEVIHDHGM